MLECAIFAILLISVIILLNKLLELKSRVNDQSFWIDAAYERIKKLEALLEYDDEHAGKEFETADLRDEERLSINEKILLREAEFDKRINAMKYEDSVAKTFHPDVHNIPHKAVDLKDSQLPDVEVTD